MKQTCTFQIGQRDPIPVAYPELIDYVMLRDQLAILNECLTDHVERVKKSTEFTRHQPDSQYKRANKASTAANLLLAQFDTCLNELSQYSYL